MVGSVGVSASAVPAPNASRARCCRRDGEASGPSSGFIVCLLVRGPGPPSRSRTTMPSRGEPAYPSECSDHVRRGGAGCATVQAWSSWCWWTTTAIPWARRRSPPCTARAPRGTSRSPATGSMRTGVCWSPGGPGTRSPSPACAPTPAAGIPAPGEPMEDAVRRRLRHELDVEVTDLRLLLPRLRLPRLRERHRRARAVPGVRGHARRHAAPAAGRGGVLRVVAVGAVPRRGGRPGERRLPVGPSPGAAAGRLRDGTSPGARPPPRAAGSRPTGPPRT